RRPFIFAGRMIVRSGSRELNAYQVATKQQVWSRKFPSPVRSVLAAGVLQVLAGGRVILVDPLDGQVLGRFTVPAAAYRLIGAYGKIGVVVSKGRRKGSTLSVRDADGKETA